MRVLVTGNEADHDCGFVGDALRDLGASLVPLLREDHVGWPALDGIDLVVSLGSSWSVYWHDVATSVKAEAALLRTAHDRGTPILGICFGSQVLAHALGGSVERAPLPEIGWYGVTPLPVADGLIDVGPWFQWHSDRWTAPDGAEVLAISPVGNQAFRIGRSTAVQFHPELNTLILDRWLDPIGRSEFAALGLDADALCHQTDREHDGARVRAAQFVDAVSRTW